MSDLTPDTLRTLREWILEVLSWDGIPDYGKEYSLALHIAAWEDDILRQDVYDENYRKELAKREALEADLRVTNQTEERAILAEHGLAEWTVEEATEGYCWYEKQKLQRPLGNRAIFLHEVAHALAHEEGQPGEGYHGGAWAAAFTRLVEAELAVAKAREEGKTRVFHHEEGFDDWNGFSVHPDDDLLEDSVDVPGG